MKRTIKRLLVLAIVLAIPLMVAIVSGAKPPECPSDHPSCKDGDTTTTTEAPTPIKCVFDEGGVLQGWDGSARHQYRCEWTVADRSTDFQFQIVGADGASIRMPYLAVTDVYPTGGDICERQMPNGQYDLEDSFEFKPFTLPDDGECTYEGNEPQPHGSLEPDSFLLTVGVQKVTPRGETLSLKLLSP